MTPGYLGTYNWRSTLLGLLLILTTNIITTQHIAAHFDYQPALGAPSLPGVVHQNLCTLQVVCMDTAFR